MVMYLEPGLQRTSPQLIPWQNLPLFLETLWSVVQDCAPRREQTDFQRLLVA